MCSGLRTLLEIKDKKKIVVLNRVLDYKLSKYVWSDNIGLFIAEDVRVKVMQSIRCGQGGDESKGPDDQNYSIVKISAVLRKIPVCVHIRAWKHKVALVYI